MAAFMAPLSGQPLIPVFIRGACTKRGGHENVALKVRSIFISLKRRRGGREACKYSAQDADKSSSSPAKKVHYVGTIEGTGRWRVGLTWSNCSHTPLSTFRQRDGEENLQTVNLNWSLLSNSNGSLLLIFRPFIVDVSCRIPDAFKVS